MKIACCKKIAYTSGSTNVIGYIMKIIFQTVTFIIWTFLLGCNDHSNEMKNASNSASKQDTAKRDLFLKKPDTIAVKKLGFYTVQGDSLLVPPFEIEISLSSKAKERIVNSKETIIIDVFLEGTPKNSSKVHLEEDGSFYVGSAKREISYGQVARFDNLKFPRKIYNQLADKDVDLTVNVYTGRKSSQDNLITGDFLGDKVSNIINKRFTMNEKLIFGDD